MTMPRALAGTVNEKHPERLASNRSGCSLFSSIDRFGFGNQSYVEDVFPSKTLQKVATC